MAVAIFAGSSSMRTISAASMAASEPRAPMAIPISALESTGASFIPSPTNASFSFSPLAAMSFSTSSTLSPGRSSLLTSSTPSSLPTASATFLASPVSMTTFSTPAALRPLMASFAFGLTTSDMSIYPAYFPSTATWISVPTDAGTAASIFIFFMSLTFPAATSCPSTTADTPCPLISFASDTLLLSISLPYASFRLLLIGWLE